jgi:hypothetical protein
MAKNGDNLKAKKHDQSAYACRMGVKTGTMRESGANFCLTGPGTPCQQTTKGFIGHPASYQSEPETERIAAA